LALRGLAHIGQGHGVAVGVNAVEFEGNGDRLTRKHPRGQHGGLGWPVRAVREHGDGQCPDIESTGIALKEGGVSEHIDARGLRRQISHLRSGSEREFPGSAGTSYLGMEHDSFAPGADVVRQHGHVDLCAGPHRYGVGCGDGADAVARG